MSSLTVLGLLAILVLLALTWTAQRWPWVGYVLAAIHFTLALVLLAWLQVGGHGHTTYDWVVILLAVIAFVVVAGLGGWFLLMGAIGRRTREARGERQPAER